MIQIFSGSTADEVWRKAASAVLVSPVNTGRGGETTERIHAVLSLTDPLARWVSIRKPPLNPAFALVEVIWMLSGRRDAAMLTFWNPRLPRFVGTDSELHGAYGWRLRKHFGIDQLSRAVHALRADPRSRQVVLQIWDPKEDLPTDLGAPANQDIPCNTSSYLKIRNGRLEWLQIMRSSDVFLGTPHNFVQFTVLHEMIAGLLEVDLGHYDMVVDSLHIYADRTADVADSVNTGEALVGKLPRFGVSQAAWPTTLRTLERLVEALLIAESDQTLLAALTEGRALPADWPAAVAVIAADAARRKNLKGAMLSAEAGCSNDLLLRLWERWRDSRETFSKHVASAAL
jgi:thymidylate synthase